MLNQKEKKIVEILKKDGIGIMPTDTIYGLVGSAFSKKAIKRIYEVKERDRKKPLIVLIFSLKDLEKFKIKISNKEKKILNKFWPGKISIVIKGTAFRLPKNKKLIEILKKTGPLVAPSANPENFRHANNIQEAEGYFGDSVDFYLSKGNVKGKSSTLIKINETGDIEVLRGIFKGKYAKRY